MNIFALCDVALVKKALRCKCPRCGEGALYRGPYSLEMHDKCSECGLDYTKNDSADGPAVFMIFILGALCVPIAIWLDFAMHPPLWVHAVLWSVVGLILTVLGLRPLKSYVMALQYKYRASDWGD